VFGRCTTIAERISSFINHISTWLLFSLMIAGIAGIVARYARAPIDGILTLSVFLLIGFVFFSLAYAQLRKRHVAIEFFVLRVGIGIRLLLRAITMLISAGACLILVLASWPYAWKSLEAGERMDGPPFFPIYPAKLSVSVGVSFLLLQIIVDLFKALKAARSQSEHFNHSKRDNE